jgi:solute carrier family 25 protein 44
MAATSNAGAQSFSQTEINWDKLDKTKFYVVGAGLFTGITVALYPVSVVKTRLQVASKDAVERNAFSIARGLLRRDGIPGLYKGFGTVITGAVPARIIFLTALETTKIGAFKLVEPVKLSEPTKAAIANGLAGMTASLFSQAVFVPIDVISQKLMVQGYSGQANYNGGLDVARKIVKADGIRGLYRGFGLSVMTYSPSSAVWWASYGSSQRLIWSFLGHGSDSSLVPDERKIVLVQATGGIVAGATASCITTPLDTIKTRLQVIGHDKGQNARQVIKSLIHDEGWKGFYRGLGPRFFSMSMWGTSMILTYEYLSKHQTFILFAFISIWHNCLLHSIPVFLVVIMNLKGFFHLCILCFVYICIIFRALVFKRMIYASNKPYARLASSCARGTDIWFFLLGRIKHVLWDTTTMVILKIHSKVHIANTLPGPGMLVLKLLVIFWKPII